jgi:acetyl-CoA carboxylase biotin carboxyl carrier protein
VSSDLSSLSDDDVRQLGRIIETLERSTFDFLQIEVGALKVTIGKGNIPVVEAAAPAPPPVAAAAPVVAPQQPSAPAAQAASKPQAAAAAQSGAVDVKSPIMGMFYTKPEPQAAPFVAVGASVREDSTVGLVEVMKTFNAVSAGVRGKIVEICAPNAQLVEFGQVLFRVLPE